MAVIKEDADLRDDSAKEQNEEEREIFSLDEYKIARYKTPGMYCEKCQETIEDAVTSKSGVLAVDANYATKITTVKYETDITNPESISEVIKESGYDNELISEDTEVQDGME